MYDDSLRPSTCFSHPESWKAKTWTCFNGLDEFTATHMEMCNLGSEFYALLRAWISNTIKFESRSRDFVLKLRRWQKKSSQDWMTWKLVRGQLRRLANWKSSASRRKVGRTTTNTHARSQESNKTCPFKSKPHAPISPQHDAASNQNNFPTRCSRLFVSPSFKSPTPRP